MLCGRCCATGLPSEPDLQLDICIEIPFLTPGHPSLFTHLPRGGVLGSSVSIALIVWAAMWLGSEVGGEILHLATAIHIVELVGNVMVLAFTAKELISPENTADFSTTICGPVKIIVAIPTIDDVLTLVSDY